MLGRIRIGEMDAEASIERYDDIHFERGGQPIDLIQTKHHLDTAPDLSDKSTDLWKTLRVWSEGLKGGLFQLPQTTLTIVTTAAAASGSAAGLLKPDINRNPKKALQLISKACRLMTGATLEPARKAFNALTRVEQESLVNAIIVLDQSPNINDTSSFIRAELGLTVRAEHIAAFQERLEGWWFGQVILRLSGKIPSPVRATDLSAHIDELRDSFRQGSLPIDYATGDAPDIGVTIDDACIFIRQLALIGMIPRRITQASTDYRRAYAQRSRWLRDNLLIMAHLKEYDESLGKDWEWAFQKMEQDVVGVTEATTLQSKGRELYDGLLEKPRPIREKCTEAYVARGSYHSLADRKLVGWHRDFDAQIV